MLHYADLKERPFFPTLINYMSSGPVVAMVRRDSDTTHFKIVCVVPVEAERLLDTGDEFQSLKPALLPSCRQSRLSVVLCI